jgi:hypothetical protein
MSGRPSAAEPSVSKPRWYVPTAGKLLVALMLLQGLTFLAARYRWFGLNHYKGYAVLLAIAVTTVCLGLLAIWVCVAWLFRARMQFSLATLLLVVLVMAIPCAWFGYARDQARRQAEVIELFAARRGQVSYDARTMPHIAFKDWPYAKRLALLGYDFYCDVVHAQVPAANDDDLVLLTEFDGLRVLELEPGEATDDGMQRLAELRHLDGIVLEGGKVTDASLAPLHKLPELKLLTLSMTNVTEAGLDRLKALPELKTLSLAGDNITNAGLDRVTELPGLVALGLEECNVTDQGFENLKQLKTLKSLRLRSVRITEVGLAHLHECRQLTSIDLSGIGAMPETLKQLREALPGCKVYHH